MLETASPANAKTHPLLLKVGAHHQHGFCDNISKIKQKTLCSSCRRGVRKM